jgi:uncharacterized protein
MNWYNEPSNWSEQANQLKVTAEAKTDFWRKTHYGFIRDNGHFYYQEVSGNFELKVKISGQYRSLYDQAGLMVRIDESTWLKCGIEFVNGVQQASAVVTHDFSDWSIIPLPDNPSALWLKLTRQVEAIEIEYSRDGETYSLLRLTYLPEVSPIQVGVMCAAPDGDGFEVTFQDYELK